MNLVCIPYHDWRKIEAEGSRTRDSHLVHHFAHSDRVDTVIVVNRPISLPEIIANKKKKNITGTVVFKRSGLKLIRVSDKLYVIDYFTTDLISPILQKRLWAFKSFGYEELYSFFKECLAFLKIEDYQVYTNNIFSINFIKRLNKQDAVFDAYDNIVFFPANQGILNELKQAYNEFVRATKFWTTNSTKNVDYYAEHYSQNKSFLVKNGVDVELFAKKYAIPADMAGLKKPVIGFGGKITHLFDFDLFNYCVARHPDKSFVIVGQILDKEVFSKISQAPNVHYLGDKPYDQYPAYVCNFDVGIVPYVTNHLESGVDSIKIYEYIAAGLNSVGTLGGGMPDMKDFVFIANDKFEFSEYIAKAVEGSANVQLPVTHTWRFKAEYIIDLLQGKEPVS